MKPELIVLFRIPFTLFWIAKYDNILLFDIVRKKCNENGTYYFEEI